MITSAAPIKKLPINIIGKCEVVAVIIRATIPIEVPKINAIEWQILLLKAPIVNPIINVATEREFAIKLSIMLSTLNPVSKVRYWE